MLFVADFFKTRTSWTEAYGLGNSWNWFGLTHLIILFVTLLFCVLMAYLYRKSDDKKRCILRWIVVGLMLLEEVWLFSIAIITDQFEIGFLPLHLCGINIFFCLAYAIKQKDWIGDMLYGLALPGALLALIVPTWTAVPPANFIFIFSTGYHIFLIAFPIMLLAGGFKPNYKNLWKVGSVLLALCVVIFGINQFNAYMANQTGNTVFWNSNFMFLYKPESVITTVANLLKLEGMSYLIVLPIMLVLVWGVCYLPWILLDKKRKENINE